MPEQLIYMSYFHVNSLMLSPYLAELDVGRELLFLVVAIADHKSKTKIHFICLAGDL